MIERTLVVLKPDAVGRSIMGEIISRFERAGLHLVGMKMVQASEDLLIGHYEGIGKLGTRRGQPIMDMVVSMMQQTPVLAMVWEGVEAVAFVRKIVGSTEPKSAAPGTIRGDYAHMSYGYLDANPGVDLFNLVHASADLEEALQEVPHWFNENELFASKALHTVYTR